MHFLQKITFNPPFCFFYVAFCSFQSYSSNNKSLFMLCSSRGKLDILWGIFTNTTVEKQMTLAQIFLLLSFLFFVICFAREWEQVFFFLERISLYIIYVVLMLRIDFPQTITLTTSWAKQTECSCKAQMVAEMHQKIWKNFANSGVKIFLSWMKIFFTLRVYLRVQIYIESNLENCVSGKVWIFINILLTIIYLITF